VNYTEIGLDPERYSVNQDSAQSRCDWNQASDRLSPPAFAGGVPNRFNNVTMCAGASGCDVLAAR
jgi:hypothetical protein